MKIGEHRMQWIRALGRFACCVGVVAALGAAPATGPQPRVVCFGDSLTKIGFGDALGAQVPAEVINAGVSGETTAAALKRLQRDVLDRHPDVVTVLYGTNDMVRDKPQPKVPLDAYAKNLGTIVDRIQAKGGRVVLCTVPPIDSVPYFKRHPKSNYDPAGGLDKIIADYCDAVRRVAAERHVLVVDLNAILKDPTDWRSADGVHPTPRGRVIIAKAIAPVVRQLLQPPQSN
ncbi:MAG: SGNH/GDSL hydrolase family protein [Tepidisphaeraceae bacterium]